MAEERIQKILARAGYASRRGAEELILRGRVTVNGVRAQIGDKADAARDELRVDGEKVTLPHEFVYYAVYKPRGVLSTTAGPDPRQKVTDLVPGGAHLHLVGRLDKDSEGLILLTNDGELTQHLTHPKYEQDKEYRVLVAKRPDQEQLGAWRRGIVLPEGERSEPADVRVDSVKGKGAWLRVIMHEGRKREIREIARTLGLPVVTLIRVRIASLYLGVLKAGQWRKLDAAEVELLKSGKKPTPTKANHKDAKNNKSRVVHKGKSSQSPNQSFKRNQGLVRKKSKNAGDKAGHKGESNRSPNQSFLRNQRLARKKSRKR